MDLPRSQVSGGFLIPNTNPGAVVARIPANAMGPASLTVTNRDGAATIYCKWIPFEQTGQANLVLADAAVEIPAGQAYTWENPPRASMLLLLSDVSNSLVGVDGRWIVPEEAQLV